MPPAVVICGLGTGMILGNQAVIFPTELGELVSHHHQEVVSFCSASELRFH